MVSRLTQSTYRYSRKRHKDEGGFGPLTFIMKKKDPKLERAGVSGYNKPKRTPNHPTKSHVVVAKCDDGSIKTIRFGQQGVSGAGKNPKTAKEADS